MALCFLILFIVLRYYYQEDEGGHGGGARSGLVDESVEISAKEFKRQMATKEEKSIPQQVQGGKRDYDEEGGSEAGQRKKPRTGEATAATSSSSPETPKAPDRSSPGNNDDYDLSDDGVRKYITNAGGRVKIADVKEVPVPRTHNYISPTCPQLSDMS